MAPGSCAPPGGSQWSPSASTASPPRFPRADQDGSLPPVSDSLTRLGVAVPEGADPLEVMARALSVAAGDLETMRVAVRGVDPTDARNPTVRLYAEALQSEDRNPGGGVRGAPRSSGRKKPRRSCPATPRRRKSLRTKMVCSVGRHHPYEPSRVYVE